MLPRASPLWYLSLMPDPVDIHPDPRLTHEQYFDLVAAGRLEPGDRVELLEGVVVAMSPQNPPHAAAVRRADAAFRRVLPAGTVISIQSPLVLGERSVPEPDLAIVPGAEGDYDDRHPTTAWLVVEVADSSLAQDRITKTRMYAAAGIDEVWIVNLRDQCIEVFRDPDPVARMYHSTSRVERGQKLSVSMVAGASIAVDDLLPRSA